MPAADDQAVWVRVERDPFGIGYLTVVAYDDDHVLSLDRTDLHAYTETLIAALTRAQYAEGVRRQLRTAGASRGHAVSDEHAAASVVELRDEWPELPTFGPYRIVPIVSIDGRPSVQVHKGEQVIVQFAPHNVAEHVVHALQVYAAADLDASYRRYLVGVIGVDERTAAGAIAALGDHLPERDGVNGLTGTHPRTKPGRRHGRKRGR